MRKIKYGVKVECPFWSRSGTPSVVLVVLKQMVLRAVGSFQLLLVGLLSKVGDLIQLRW